MSKKRPRSARTSPPRRRTVRLSRVTPRTRTRTRGRVRRAAAAPTESVEIAFDLQDLSGQPVTDPDALFTFRRLTDNRQIGDQIQRPLSGARLVFPIPVQNGDVAVCELDLQRYRFARSPVFFRSPGPRISKIITLCREPLEWTPAYTNWTALPAAFDELKAALASNVVMHKTQQPLGQLTGVAYDAMQGADVILAKTCLLNTHFRLRTALEPVSDSRSWFSFVQRIIAIDRERFLAFVDPAMETIVQQIHDHIDDFRADYERTPAENHRGNVPAAMQARITRMVSIKSTHAHGNFQLTLTILANPAEVLLDADIDENGQAVAHLFDLLKHRFSGGTHPHDIHEILMAQHGMLPGFDLGYRLA